MSLFFGDSTSRFSIPSKSVNQKQSSTSASGTPSSSSSSPTPPVASSMNSSAHDCAEMNSDSLAVHTLRSKTQYTHNFRYRPRNQLFLAAFWEVYRLFVDRKVIPHDCRRRLESFSVAEEDFIQLVIKNELTDGQFIELLDN